MFFTLRKYPVLREPLVKLPPTDSLPPLRSCQGQRIPPFDGVGIVCVQRPTHALPNPRGCSPIHDRVRIRTGRVIALTSSHWAGADGTRKGGHLLRRRPSRLALIRPSSDSERGVCRRPLTLSATAETSPMRVWIGVRSVSKATYPGKWDQMVAGGQRSGIG